MNNSSLSFSIETDITECEKLWNQFSPKENLSDLWEFRQCFHLSNESKPYFIVGLIDQKPIGIIPLEFDNYYKEYIFFGGGDWVEKSRFMIDEQYKKQVLPAFFENLPAPHDLGLIDESETNYTDRLTPQEPTFFLTPSEYEYNMENYLAAFSYKRRKSVRRDIRTLEESKPQILINNFDDLPMLIAFNRQQFGDESSFIDPWFEKTILSLPQNEVVRPLLRLFSIVIDDRIVAVALCSFYNNVFCCLQTGVDPTIPNISKFLHYRVIEKAFADHADRVDFLTDDCNWKTSWRFKSEMLYKFI